MEPHPLAARSVPVDVLPPVPQDERPSSLWAKQGEPPLAGLRTFYHPAGGVVILGVDVLVFGTELFSAFLDVIPMSILAFLVTYVAVFVIQRKWAGNSTTAAAGKAFLGAFLAALPFPISGTLLGAAVLVMSGLPHHPVEMLRRLASGRSLVDSK